MADAALDPANVEAAACGPSRARHRVAPGARAGEEIIARGPIRRERPMRGVLHHGRRRRAGPGV